MQVSDTYNKIVCQDNYFKQYPIYNHSLIGGFHHKYGCNTPTKKIHDAKIPKIVVHITNFKAKIQIKNLNLVFLPK
jgi:hypothetical protein